MHHNTCPMTRRHTAPPTPLAPQEEPVMKRYANPLPCWSCCTWPASSPDLDRVLEELTRQSQLLTDLLGAVNALTAATLSIRSRFVGELPFEQNHT